MSNTRLRFPRLNLPRSGSDRLLIIGTYDADDERIALLADRFDGSSEDDQQIAALSVTRYKTRGVFSAVHVVSGSFFRNERKPREIDILINYLTQADEASPSRSL